MNVVYSEEQAIREHVQPVVDRLLRPLVETKYDFSRPLTHEDVMNLRADVARHEIATSPPLPRTGARNHLVFASHRGDQPGEHRWLPRRALFFPV